MTRTPLGRVNRQTVLKMVGRRSGCVPRCGRDVGVAAFTLLELLIALSLIVVLMALIWPGLMHLFFEQKLQRAAADIQREMADARIAAISAGEPYQFEFEPAGIRYRVGPQQLAMMSDDQTENTHTPVESQLDDDLQFRSRNGGTVSGLTAESAGGAEWGTPVVFRPDGSSDDVEFEIVDPERDRPYVLIRVRGLTGGVSVGLGRDVEGREP